MTDIITLKERAETAYRAVRKLAEENDEFDDHLKLQIEMVREALEFAGRAERTTTGRYATAILYAEDILRICYHDFDISPETVLDPDINEAIKNMLYGADPWDEIAADDQKKKEGSEGGGSMTTDKTPAYYVAWSEALREVDYNTAPLYTRGVGKTPEDAILHADRICIHWFDTHNRPIDRGAAMWMQNLDTIRVWAVVYDAPGPIDPGVQPEYIELSRDVVRGIVRSLYPEIGNTDEKKEA